MSYSVDIFIHDRFKESEHPRGQPDNPGQFVESGTGGRKSAASHLKPAPKSRESWPTHIKAMKVPPAWTYVHISTDPKAALQVTGHDVKGRKQYIYNKRYAESQAEAKFARIKELSKKFDSIQRENDKNRISDDEATREHADVTSLIMALGIRPGGEQAKADKKSYGATTLEGQHVVKVGKEVHLKFLPGKKKKEDDLVDLTVTDPNMAHMLLQRSRKAGANGKLFPNVSPGSLLDYVHGFDGGGFKTKDFRTLVGTKQAEQYVKALPEPKNMTAYKNAVKTVAIAVSETLGNTPTVALQSYINPVVFAGWRRAAGV